MRRTLILTLVILGLLTERAEAQYLPVGPQQNVALSTILGGGWTQCYAELFGTPIGNDAEHVLSQCQGENIMMAGRATGSDMFLLLAQGALSDVTANTGAGTSNTHVVNGAQWYFSSQWSWGFAPIGEAVDLHSCDTASGAQHMCLHTLDWTGGYRIGDIAGLNDSQSYEKVFFVNGGVIATPEPASFVLMATGLVGIVGVARRRRSR